MQVQGLKQPSKLQPSAGAVSLLPGGVIDFGVQQIGE